MDYPKEYLKYIELFNREEFWEAHEILEVLWQVERGDIRPFYQGLIQIAAIFYHLQENTPKGCPKILRTATEHLSPFLPVTLDLNVEELLGLTQKAIVEDTFFPKIELIVKD